MAAISDGAICGLIAATVVFGALGIGLATFDMTPASAPVQPAVSAPVTTAPPSPVPSEPTAVPLDDSTTEPQPPPVIVYHGGDDDDDHGWVHRRVCGRHWWC